MPKWIVAALIFEAAILAMLLTVALDLYAHTRVDELGGVNMRGYRGPVAHQKQPNEIRVALVGGTRAFGWGMAASETTASELRRLIMLATDRRGGQLRPVVVINLGKPGALPDSYPAMIDRFAYLRPDYICLYDDLGVAGADPAERASAVFELSGYAPVLPLVLREKGMVWRFGDVQRGYAPPQLRAQATTPLLRRTAGAALQTAGGAAESIDRALARLISDRSSSRTARSADADGYADAMMTAVEAAHRHARGVVVAVSPPETAQQSRNLLALEDRLEPQRAATPWLRFVSLADTGQLYDSALRLDGWNYSAAGNATAAASLAPALLELIAQQ